MTPKTKGFAGVAVATALVLLALFAFDGFRRAMIASKSKRLLVNGIYLNDAVVRYRKTHGEYPRIGEEIIATLPQRRERDFDYFRDGNGYTLIYHL